MKLLTIIFILIFVFAGCAEKSFAPPSAEVNQAVLEFLTKEPYEVQTKIHIKGISLDEAKPGVYLVFADIALNDKPSSRKFIAQKYHGQAGDYWQVVSANEQNLKALGIYFPTGKNE